MRGDTAVLVAEKDLACFEGYAWLNDGDTKRTYESRDDAYRIFRKMLEGGQPPVDWDRLLAEARAEADRLQKLVVQTSATKP